MPPSFQDKHGAEGKVCLGFCVQGIVVYSVHEDVKTQLHHYPWQKIKNVSFAVSGLHIVELLCELHFLQLGFFLDV